MLTVGLLKKSELAVTIQYFVIPAKAGIQAELKITA
jgi:hypothetical protein|tara:strand:+ start:563 stop:670 length:108 start_codon:yes stop_codon:yes gene_type:complete